MCRTKNLHSELYKVWKSCLLSEYYSDAPSILFELEAVKKQNKPRADHLTDSWTKKDHTSSLRQHPSDRDKYAICKTRAAKVYMVGVWAGRMTTHLCLCQQRLGFSHSQMAGAVFILLSGAAKIDNYTPRCQKLAATHQLKWVSVWLPRTGVKTKWDISLDVQRHSAKCAK